MHFVDFISFIIESILIGKINLLRPILEKAVNQYLFYDTGGDSVK